MGLENVGTEIYAIHGYFRGLTIGQRNLGFLGFHTSDGKGVTWNYGRFRLEPL